LSGFSVEDRRPDHHDPRYVLRFLPFVFGVRYLFTSFATTPTFAIVAPFVIDGTAQT
jgi:hypothetical protein